MIDDVKEVMLLFGLLAALNAWLDCYLLRKRVEELERKSK